MENSTLNCLVHYYVSGVHCYRVRGVDGSFAQHLTVESYMVIIFQQSYLLVLVNLVFHHALTLPFQVCLHILSHRSLSFCSSGFTTWIPQTVYCHFLAYVFYFLLFLFFTLFSCRFLAVDYVDSCRLSSAR